MMQTIRYGRARLVRFEAVKVYTYSGYAVGFRVFGGSTKRAGITSLRRR